MLLYLISTDGLSLFRSIILILKLGKPSRVTLIILVFLWFLCMSYVLCIFSFVVALNTRKSQSTGKTPFEVVFGQLPNTLERFSLNVDGEVLQEEDLSDSIQFSSISSEDVLDEAVIGEDVISPPVSNKVVKENDCTKGNKKITTITVNGKLQIPQKVVFHTKKPSIQISQKRTYTSHVTISLSSKSNPVTPAKSTTVAPDQADLITSDTEDLPAVNFTINRSPCSVKRKANSSLSGIEKIQRLLEEKCGEEAVTPLPPIKSIDVNFSSSESEPDEEVEVEHVIIHPKETLVRKEINMVELLKFLDNNIYDILSLPFSFKDEQFRNDTLAQEYLDVYEQETEAVMAELKKHDPTLKILNVKHTDRLLWLSAKTVEKYLADDKKNTAPRKTMETSPNRKRIREEVRKNLGISAQRMRDRYSKRKRMVVREFRVGENVAVRVPIQDRAKTDARRVPAVVVKVKGPNYKLACRYGTLTGYFSASDLIPFPGHVAIANEDEEIPLRTAAKKHSLRKSDVFFCKCRKSCKNKHCVCVKKGLSCNGRCHSGKSCKNHPGRNVKDSDEISSCSEQNTEILVNYGGQFGSEYFSNSCPIDNLLAMLCLIREDYSDCFVSLVNISSANSDFNTLLNLIKENKILQAKFHLALLNNLTPKRRTYDFHGDESKFFNHCIFLLKYESISECSHECCQVGLLKQDCMAIPSVSQANSNSVESFQDSILKWLTHSFYAPCRRKLIEPLPPDEFIHWDTNSLT